MKNIVYFSDGCAGQYKNCKNFINLMHHRSDFGINASWSFFCTSHGKGACDGIGGTVKRTTKHESLRRPVSNQILNVYDMYSFCQDRMPCIDFYLLKSSDIETQRNWLKMRFEQAKTIKGTRSYHYFSPINVSTIGMKLVSLDNDYAREFTYDAAILTNTMSFAQGVYVCSKYDSNWYIGVVEEVSGEDGDVKVRFMHPKGPSLSYHWPANEDSCWVPFDQVLCTIDCPIRQNVRGQYHLTQRSQREIQNKI
jgi:hypothetical protein